MRDGPCSRIPSRKGAKKNEKAPGRALSKLPKGRENGLRGRPGNRLPRFSLTTANAARLVLADRCRELTPGKVMRSASVAQAKDEELLHKARRIQARALRRAGELLKQIDGRGGDRKSDDFKKDAAVHFDDPQPPKKPDSPSASARRPCASTSRQPEKKASSFR
jgi:hypothetical protein